MPLKGIASDGMYESLMQDVLLEGSAREDVKYTSLTI